ncbi:survival motor neuron interacting protein 1-domain-containing protein [Glomus cerebriforme]|uniref:Gem-associated protein 2 n=1 Tax=Glomus cerebriforme TaxID=658196 RepID=A0A397T5P1_9GLOM|nr:survival motor neuron interacting protein 1-domain-containing protein [Glomus cerebriforme]
MEQLTTLPIVTDFEEDLYEKEDEELVQRALPVSDKSLPKRPPATGEEYLRMVRLEANKRPTVVIAKNQITKSKEVRMAGWVKRGWANQTELDNQNSNSVNEEWEKIFLMKFDLIRQRLEKHIQRTLKSSRNKSSIKLPTRNDEAGWLKFCYGIDESSNLVKSKELESEGDVNMMTLPCVSIVSRIDQATTITLLLHHIKWLSDDRITIAQSQWLFALFLRIDKLLTPNQMAILRQLCKKCIQIRQKTDEEDLISLASLDIIIIIVRKYFGQKDLL